MTKYNVNKYASQDWIPVWEDYHSDRDWIVRLKNIRTIGRMKGFAIDRTLYSRPYNGFPVRISMVLIRNRDRTRLHKI